MPDIIYLVYDYGIKLRITMKRNKRYNEIFVYKKDLLKLSFNVKQALDLELKDYIELLSL